MWQVLNLYESLSTAYILYHTLSLTVTIGFLDLYVFKIANSIQNFSKLQVGTPSALESTFGVADRIKGIMDTLKLETDL